MNYTIAVNERGAKTVRSVLPHVQISSSTAFGFYYMTIDNEEDFLAFKLAIAPSNIINMLTGENLSGPIDL